MKSSYARRYRRITKPVKSEGNFFKKESHETFFGEPSHERFFQPSITSFPSQSIQRKCEECANEEKQVQRVEDKKEEEKKVMRATDKKEEEKVQREPEKKEEEKVQRALEKKEEEKVMKMGDKKEEEKVQKKEATAPVAQSSATAASYISSISGKGQSMNRGIQTFYENKMGADFSDVKVHTGKEAAESAKDIHAQAYTYGDHIVFNEGKYQPESGEGKHLLAHELAHVVQQGKKNGFNKISRRIGDGHDFPATSAFSRNVQLESVFDNTATVSSGSSGAHVTLIQNALIALHYELPRFGADGSFGDETRRAVRAFQQDVGLSVDGVVGFHTIDFLDKRSRGAEVAPPALPVVANTPFNTANAIVQPGAVPTHPFTAGVWGSTFEENIQVTMNVFNNGGIWQPVLRGVIGNYSLQNRLLGRTEVTGPGGNTTAANYCPQINDLNSLTLTAGTTWFMRSAVLAHERVHAEKLRTSLIDPSVINPLETAIEAITTPVTLLAPNEAMAELFIRNDPRFTTAIGTAMANWTAQISASLAGDHSGGTGPAYTAEHSIVDPMIRRICRHARTQGWAHCPPLCP
ncbi:MAG: DUF4157 domain-containing protein [Ferruginibacter sp.]